MQSIKLLQKRIDKTDQRCALANEEKGRSSPLEAIAEKLKYAKPSAANLAM